MKRKTIDELSTAILEEDIKKQNINNKVFQKVNKSEHLTHEDLWKKLGIKPPEYEEYKDKAQEVGKDKLILNRSDLLKKL